MGEKTLNPRTRLVRDTAVLQLKLMVDGVRDALLIPVSLMAAVLGLVRGGDQANREFQRVIKWGRRSERWINLFGHQSPRGRTHPSASMDLLLDRVEQVVLDQYRRGRNTDEAREAIKAALEDSPGGEMDKPGTQGEEPGDPGQQAP